MHFSKPTHSRMFLFNTSNAIFGHENYEKITEKVRQYDHFDFESKTNGDANITMFKMGLATMIHDKLNEYCFLTLPLIAMRLLTSFEF